MPDELLEAPMLDGTYTELASGTFKEVYLDYDAEMLAYVPKRGDDLRDRLENVLAWEKNLEVLEEAGLEVPMADWDTVVGEFDGEPSAALVCDYDPSVRTVRRLGRAEREQYEDEFDRYEETIEELMDEGEYIAVFRGEYDEQARNRNLGVSDEGPVVLDFGEAGRYREDWLNTLYLRYKASDVYGSKDRFLEDHGIDDRVDAVLGEEHGLYGRVKEAIGL